MGGVRGDASIAGPYGGTGDTSPHLDEFTEADSLRLTAELALDGHRIRLTRQEKDEVVRLALAQGWTRARAARQLGVSVETFGAWAKRAGVGYPVDVPPLWWVHGYIRTDRPRRKATLS